MAEERRKKGLPEPDWKGVERFDPLLDDAGDVEWREVRHGLNSMDLLVDQKLGGKNARGEVEWITNEQVMLRLPNPNTISIRWHMGKDEWGNYGLSEPRIRLTIWRW